MRGCPGAGKSWAAKKLAGKTGVVCETDSFFGPPGKNYRFDIRHREEAREQNMRLFLLSIHQGVSPIIVDRGCGKGRRTWWYAKTAKIFGYTVKLAEPTSPWWKQIKEEYEDIKPLEDALTPGLAKFIPVLYELQKGTHKVSWNAIIRSLLKYDPTLTIEDILREGR